MTDRLTRIDAHRSATSRTRAVMAGGLGTTITMTTMTMPIGAGMD